MIMKKLKLWCFAIISFCSCRNASPEHVKPVSDTIKVLELAIRTAFYHDNLPDLSSLKQPYYFKDSILVTSKNLPISILPQTIDSFKFKILTKSKIDSLSKLKNNFGKLPNYLCVRSLERSDTSFYVILTSESMLPLSGGGSISITILKDKDSLIVKNISASSIN
jgi:hypothetical protein